MAEQENSASEFDRLSADAMEILLDEAQDEGMFEEALRLNSGNPGILRLLCGHPASPPRVRDEAARVLGLTAEKAPYLPGGKSEQTEEAKRENLAQKIRALTAGEKIRISVKAGREARSLLIKDSNKQVVLGVIANPRITVSEVEMAARTRSLPEEALREIAKNKEWVKNYSVIYNLVSNSKTPPGVTVGFLPWIKSKDLNLIARNKDIPDAVRTAARRFSEVRAKKRQA